MKCSEYKLCRKESQPGLQQVGKLAMALLSMAVMLGYRALLCGSRNYPYLPHRRDRIFQGGGGGSIWLIFQWGGGVHHRKIFPEGSCDG